MSAATAAAVTETATVTPTRVFVLSPPMPEERERPALLVRLSECLG